MSHTIRSLRAGDRAKVAAFAGTLPEHDLLFLSRDLRHPRVLDAWIDAVSEGWIDGLVAVDRDTDGEPVLGTAALVRDPLSWSAHVGEVRLLVDPARRGVGLGRDLLEAVFAIAARRSVTKLSARMTADQARSIALFESLGFEAEARLVAEVQGRDGPAHDLVILSKFPGRNATPKPRP